MRVGETWTLKLRKGRDTRFDVEIDELVPTCREECSYSSPENHSGIVYHWINDELNNNARPQDKNKTACSLAFVKMFEKVYE